MPMPASFDAETLRALRDAKEVRIRTGKQAKGGVVIWIVVPGNEVFVRSVRGPTGAWYKHAAAAGTAVLEVDGREILVRAVPVSETAEIDRVSQAYLAKYEPSPWAKEMVRPEVLSTTLRLEPR